MISLPNAVTLARLLLVPVIVWAMATANWYLAFWIFCIAGLSDAIDGSLARWTGQTSQLGAYLDPIADKLLMISTFAGLGTLGGLPVWLVVMVVFRDAGILGGVMLAREMGHPVAIRPLLLSKVNTACQIMLAGFALGAQAQLWNADPLVAPLVILCAGLTLASALAYAVVWLRHLHGEME